MLHREEPLRGELRFDSHVGALREAHLVGVVLYLLHQSCLAEIDGNLLAHVHAVHAHIHTCSIADSTVVIEDVNRFEVVFQSQRVVVDVVSRSNLQASRTELYFHVIILDNGDFPAHERHDYVLALEPRVLGVVGVDAHCGIAHDSLRTGGCHHGVVTLLVFVQHVLLRSLLNVALHHTVFEVIEL